MTLLNFFSRGTYTIPSLNVRKVKTVITQETE